MSEEYSEIFNLWEQSAKENEDYYRELDKELDEADID